MTEHDALLYARSFDDVYDRWYHDLDDPADLVKAFARHCPPESRILELGAGTGRLSTPLSASGFDVVALDASAVMLSEAPTGYPRVGADMASLPFGDATFDAVLIAYNTFFNLSPITLQQQCLDDIARVLRVAGVVAIDAFISEEGPSDGFGLSRRPHPDDPSAELFILTGPDAHDPDVLVGSHIERGQQTTCRPWRVAYQTPADLDRSAATAGLELQRRASDWNDEPLDEDSRRHVSWYTRA